TTHRRGTRATPCAPPTPFAPAFGANFHIAFFDKATLIIYHVIVQIVVAHDWYLLMLEGVVAAFTFVFIIVHWLPPVSKQNHFAGDQFGTEMFFTVFVFP